MQSQAPRKQWLKASNQLRKQPQKAGFSSKIAVSLNKWMSKVCTSLGCSHIGSMQQPHGRADLSADHGDREASLASNG